MPRLNPDLPDWRELVRMPEAELKELDVAAVNLACAVGLPGWERMRAGHCLKCLDDWAVGVRQVTEELIDRVFRPNPSEYRHSEPLFRAAKLVHLLQGPCGVIYNPAKREPKPGERYEAVDRFIYGAIQGPGGTCASMPVVFAAVARRVGYPIRLVTTKCHVFCRWDDPDTGVRFNVEGTNESGMSDFPDQYYRQGVHECDTREERYFGYLQSMTPREELALFLEERAGAAQDSGADILGVEALVAASEIDPHPFGRCMIRLGRLIHRWGNRLKEQNRVEKGFKYPTSPTGPRRWPTIPWPWEAEIISLEAAEQGQEPRWISSKWDDTRPLPGK